MVIRPIKSNETILLTDFIYESIFQRDRNNLLPRTIIQEPAFWVYINEFGTKKDDYCLVAEINKKIVGAVWVRCINGFGQVDETTPEFAISVYYEYRGQKIGTKLMKEMLKHLKIKGYSKTSLSVQKDNYAVKMYQDVGFEIYKDHNDEYIMVCELNKI